MQPSDPALSRVAAANAASLRVALGRANGWTILHSDAVSAISNAQPRHHRAVVTDPSVAQRDIATVLDEFFDADVSRYVIEDPWGRDWSAAGFEAHATMAIMACHARQRPRGSDDLEIVEVSNVARLGEFERTLVDAFPLLDHRPGRPGALWTPGVLELADLRLLLGLRDGAPIGTACAWVHDGVVGVYWIAVQPHHHGRGYGSALTAAALTPGTPAVLVATAAGEPVYRRLGFRTRATTTWWTRSRSGEGMS